MARHRSFSFDFKRQVGRDFLEGRPEMHEVTGRYNLFAQSDSPIDSGVRGGRTDLEVGSIRLLH
jgi:hypothetical protein